MREIDGSGVSNAWTTVKHIDLKHRILPCVALIAVAVLSGCYSFSSRVDSHIDTVAVPFFENSTTRFGLSEKLTEAVARGFVEDGDLKVVDERAADSVLRGVITGYDLRAAVFDQTETVSKMRVVITLDVVFRDLTTGEVVWEQKNLSKWGEYRLVADGAFPAESEEDGQDYAIEKVVEDILARSIETW